MQREKQFALLRILFGVVWAINAFLKWQPGFWSAGGSFLDNFTSALSGQGSAMTTWLTWWIGIVSPHPEGWALLVALCETAIAVGLIFGLFTRTTILGGMVLSFLIWAVPEAFGGPYMLGMTTDIGAGIIYMFVFATLWVGKSWQAWSLDPLF